MEYCGNCGEPAEGRFCRMCGSAVGDPTAQATQAMAAVPAGYAEATQGMPAVPAQAGYGAEPTQLVGALPEPPLTQPPSEFDSLFRTADGAPGLHGQTQVLPPVVETDYRMQPPGGGAYPPGSDEGDEPRTNRPVVIATIGAVVVAAGLILGLLYLGGSGNSGSNASSTTSARAGGATASASQAAVISVPTNTAPPSAASTSAVPTTGAYHGDSLPLGPGSQGSLVKWVQEKLKSLGYYQGTVTGTFDQATALAVQQFQAAAGVTGDPASTVGQHTRLALAAAGSTPSLRPGARSADVSRLNQSLNYAEGASLSGSRYSTTTTAAVAFYQQQVGLPPSGMMDAATWAKLQSGTLAGAKFSGYGFVSGD